MKNFVIAITRTCGSGGTTIGKMISNDYGINMYDRELLRLASEDSGINELLFLNVDEHVKKSLLYKVSKKVYQGELIHLKAAILRLMIIYLIIRPRYFVN